MSSEGLIRKFHEMAGYDSDVALDADSLIGFFQLFRPDGTAIEGAFEGLPWGDGVESRLQSVFAAAGDDRRPQGGRDAYFVVRKPPPLDPQQAESLTLEWLEGIRELAIVVGDAITAESLDPIPSVRVLEGIAPKHPKLDHEKSDLLKTFQQEVPGMVERLDVGAYAVTLRPAFYFIACDAMLRDYLMWPMYAASAGMDGPFDPYFQLWRHGIKYRIFGERQIDVYLPRSAS